MAQAQLAEQENDIKIQSIEALDALRKDIHLIKIPNVPF